MAQEISEYLYRKLSLCEGIPSKNIVLNELGMSDEEFLKHTQTHPLLYQLVDEFDFEVKAEMQSKFEERPIETSEVSPDVISFRVAEACLSVAARNNDEPPPSASNAIG